MMRGISITRERPRFGQRPLLREKLPSSVASRVRPNRRANLNFHFARSEFAVQASDPA
jgi:hypothetical protein